MLSFIAQQARRNIRELEGSLNRVVAFAKLLRAEPTVELAARALKDIAGQEPAAAAPASVIAAVADSFQLAPEDISGRKRDKATATARRLAMYLLRQETNFSLTDIGRQMGNRDASAVNLACRSVAGDLEKNAFLKRKLQEIQQSLGNGRKPTHGR